MSNDPLTFEEQLEALAGIVLALSYVLSADQREDTVRLLRTHADQGETPERSAALLRHIAELIKRPSEPTQH
ncbi:MAG: hypothetical protein ACT4PS_02545 [Betaproteobacteria bacterium]